MVDLPGSLSGLVNSHWNVQTTDNSNSCFVRYFVIASLKLGVHCMHVFCVFSVCLMKLTTHFL